MTITPCAGTVPMRGGEGGRLLTIPPGNLMARRAALRMLAVWPLHLPARDTVQHADLQTSTCDCRVALSLALGRSCDLDGFVVDGGEGWA
jgi:hypothetical protein